MYTDRAWAEDRATRGRDLSAAQGQDRKGGSKPPEYRLRDWLQSDKSIHSLCFVPTPLTSRAVCPIYAEPIQWPACALTPPTTASSGMARGEPPSDLEQSLGGVKVLTRSGESRGSAFLFLNAFDVRLRMKPSARPCGRLAPI
jgi:hypothetical protein